MQPHMIRILAIDLDGTLLNREREISQPNLAAVSAAVLAGVTVVLASGRIRPSMAPFAHELGLHGAMICSNGAHVICVGERELLHRDRFATLERLGRVRDADAAAPEHAEDPVPPDYGPGGQVVPHGRRAYAAAGSDQRTRRRRPGAPVSGAAAARRPRAAVTSTTASPARLHGEPVS